MVLTGETMVLVHVETDEGLVGVGGGPVGGSVSAELIERQVGDLVVGLDPTAIEQVLERLQPVVNEYLWPWCIELAVWDLHGKIAGEPVHRLLGGYHDSLPAYASLGERRSPEERVEDVRRLREEGFRAVKLRFRHDHPGADLEVVRAIRDAHGDAVDLMVDANQGHVMPTSDRYRIWDMKTALYIGDALHELGVLWLEEPLPRRHYRELAELTRATRIPVAGGELNTGMSEFWQMIEQRCYDIVQADAAFSGGLWTCRKIAALTEAAGLQFVPHTWSNEVAFHANFHLALSTPSCGWLEIPYDPPAYLGPIGSTLLTEPLRLDENGRVQAPTRPGFGIELNADVVSEMSVA